MKYAVYIVVVEDTEEDLLRLNDISGTVELHRNEIESEDEAVELATTLSGYWTP